MAFSIVDLSNGPGKTFFPDMMVTSPDHRGATGPLLDNAGNHFVPERSHFTDTLKNVIDRLIRENLI